MVLGKAVVDGRGDKLGEIVDVGLFSHRHVKFLVVEDRSQRVPMRTFAVDRVDHVTPETVTLRL